MVFIPAAAQAMQDEQRRRAAQAMQNEQVRSLPEIQRMRAMQAMNASRQQYGGQQQYGPQSPTAQPENLAQLAAMMGNRQPSRAQGPSGPQGAPAYLTSGNPGAGPQQGMGGPGQSRMGQIMGEANMGGNPRGLPMTQDDIVAALMAQVQQRQGMQQGMQQGGLAGMYDPLTRNAAGLFGPAGIGRAAPVGLPRDWPITQSSFYGTPLPNIAPMIGTLRNQDALRQQGEAEMAAFNQARAEAEARKNNPQEQWVNGNPSVIQNDDGSMAFRPAVKA